MFQICLKRLEQKKKKNKSCRLKEANMTNLFFWWGCVGSSLQHSGFSCFAVRLLSSPWAQQLQCAGSVVVALGLCTCGAQA